MSDFTNRSRSGLTLVETSVALIVASTIFGIAVHLLTLTMQSAGEIKQRTSSPAATMRLAERFRADVHAALEVVVHRQSEQVTGWIIKLGDGARTEYELHGGFLQWTKYRDNKIEARDAFPLPDAAEVRIELEPKESRTFAGLLLKFGEANGDFLSNALRIDAAIGRDKNLRSEAVGKGAGD